MSKWISVTDHLPSVKDEYDTERYLVCITMGTHPNRKKKLVVEAKWDGYHGHFYIEDCKVPLDVSHWMPWSSPPTDDEDFQKCFDSLLKNLADA